MTSHIEHLVHHVRPGDPLPDLTLLDTKGHEVALASLGGEETLIIFLRHLA